MKTKPETENPLRCLLAGTPNCGKSTLFNRLTGGNQHVGNWHGKTIECKEGECSIDRRKVKLVDLPGTYSLTPYSEEEMAAVQAMFFGEHDVAVQVADACHLERSLFFTLSLLEKCSRVVVALNKSDEAMRRGMKIDTDALERKFGVPFVLVSAKKGDGIAALLAKCTEAEGGECKTRKICPPSPRERHLFVKKAIDASVSGIKERGDENRIDFVLLNPWLGAPLFVLIMWLVFQLTFTVSAPATELIDAAFTLAGGEMTALLALFGTPEWAGSLLQDGIIAGIGSVFVFAPAIFMLFFLLHSLEDTGYLARIAVLLDGWMGRAGLSGRAAMPLILGFGCNVPAIMATRILDSREDRLAAMAAVPFMSCTARLPVFTLFAGAFFAGNQGEVLLFLYVFGAASGLLTAFAFRKFFLRSEKAELAIELPDYQMPTWGTVASQAWLGTKEFGKKAGTIILACSVLVWFLASMPQGVEYGSKDSFAGALGSAISPIFAPLGFGDWQSSVSLLFGFVAKEVVVGAMATAHGAGEEELSSALVSHFSPLSALSFMVFVLLYVPCIATIAVMKKESGSALFALAAAAYYVAFAWLASFIIYSAGVALEFG